MKPSTTFLLILLLPLVTLAQEKPPPNWFNLDYKSDRIWGVSTEKLYQKFVFSKNEQKIVVAVIDGGIDIFHENLSANIWKNNTEIADNNIDEDSNGYTDDVYGWDFIGGKDSMVVEDTYEYTRIVGSYISKGTPENYSPGFKDASSKEAKRYAAAKEAYTMNSTSVKNQKAQVDDLLYTISQLAKQTGSIDPDEVQIKRITTSGQTELVAKMLMGIISKTGGMTYSPIIKNLTNISDDLNKMLRYNLNLYFDPRSIVGDHYEDINEWRYGNNKVVGPRATHGTHVAGIIAASRDNNTSIKGICSKVQLMVLRVVPDGDERDKDVANAIRYAVDNGAKIINMSFGKSFSPNKNAVDLAVKYAMEKDVLIIHASGNDGNDLEKENIFPNPRFEDSNYTAPNWIEVGASGWRGGKKTVVNFTNYGKKTVAVFAPGEDINSCVPGNDYDSKSGTSMAAPVVSGIAALIRQNYPHFTALQTKQIILQSAVKYKRKIIIPGTKKKAHLSDLCITGGIINAYEAMMLAERVNKGQIKL
ncbi:MAG: S8 family serine peptidase [Bacteroidia bacterium]|nr:S8 family serine peptidase [Bacteroidia bacterium]